jgi:integrase
MPSGACAIRREGKRGVTWSLKFVDATGRQCWERLGREPGWTEAKTQRELGKRLQAVERDRWRKPTRVTFATFEQRFRTEYLPGRNLKPSAVIDYEGSLANHLTQFFGHLELAAIDPADVDAYIAAKAGELSPKTIANHLGLLAVLFKVAMRWRLVASNPATQIDRPRVEQTEMNVLTEPEVARLLAAYSELEAEATDEERPWWRLTRRLVAVALGTALRRGELLALRWRDVQMLEGRLTVRESLVRGKFQAPKSRASRRTIDLGTRTVAVLQEQWKESAYRAGDSLVFAHPDGNPSVYVQMRADHSQGSITERYVHAAQVLFPGAAERGEERLFGHALAAPEGDPNQ